MGADGFEELRSVLSQTKLTALAKDQKVVTLKDSVTVEDALRILAHHRILSAPVLRATPPGSEVASAAGGVPDASSPIVGFVDIRDILSSFLKELDDAVLKDTKMLRRMRTLETAGASFASRSLSELHGLGSDGWFVDSRSALDGSALDLIRGFLHPHAFGLDTMATATSGAQEGGKEGGKEGGEVPPPPSADSRSLGSRTATTRERRVVHRLALVDAAAESPEGARGPALPRMLCILSQSDAVRAVAARLPEALARASIESLGLVRGKVVSVSPATPALEALAQMKESDISALAVVGEDGAMIGNFSISELRTIMAEHFGSLALPVGEFLALEHGTEYAGYVAQRETEPGTPRAARAQRFAADRARRGRDGFEPSPGGEVGQRLVVCAPQDSLEKLLQLFACNVLHRVYVCDPAAKPLGVITLTDVLATLVDGPHKVE